MRAKLGLLLVAAGFVVFGVRSLFRGNVLEPIADLGGALALVLLATRGSDVPQRAVFALSAAMIAVILGRLVLDGHVSPFLVPIGAWGAGWGLLAAGLPKWGVAAHGAGFALFAALILSNPTHATDATLLLATHAAGLLGAGLFFTSRRAVTASA